MNTFDPMLTVPSQRNDGPKTLLQKNQRNVSVAASIKKKQQNVEQKENKDADAWMAARRKRIEMNRLLFLLWSALRATNNHHSKGHDAAEAVKTFDMVYKVSSTARYLTDHPAPFSATTSKKPRKVVTPPRKTSEEPAREDKKTATPKAVKKTQGTGKPKDSKDSNGGKQSDKLPDSARSGYSEASSKN